jgi:hypothetical protein
MCRAHLRSSGRHENRRSQHAEVQRNGWPTIHGPAYMVLLPVNPHQIIPQSCPKFGYTREKERLYP